jgi:hypothetical protein
MRPVKCGKQRKKTDKQDQNQATKMTNDGKEPAYEPVTWRSTSRSPQTDIGG